MKKIIFILSFFLLIYTPYVVCAENVYNIIDDIETVSDFDAKETAKNVLSGKMTLSFSDVIEKIVSLFIGGIKENIPLIVKLTAVSVLSGLILNISTDKMEIGVYAAVAIVSLLAIKMFSYSVTVTVETIDTLFIFISSLMPSVATAATITGVASGGAAASAFIAMQIFIYICKEALIPLICVTTVFGVSDKMGSVSYISGVTALLKQILKWVTGFMITIYGVVIALQTQAASGFDSLSGKSIKYAIGSFVPVVGNALSDSLETVILSAKTVVGALGITGIIGVCYICFVPLINVCAISMSFKIAGAISGVASLKRVSDAVNEIGESIGKVSLVLVSVVVMFIISLATLCKFGGA